MNVIKKSVVDKEFAACDSQRRDDLNRSKGPPKQSLDGGTSRVSKVDWATRPTERSSLFLICSHHTERTPCVNTASALVSTRYRMMIQPAPKNTVRKCCFEASRDGISSTIWSV